MPSKIFQTKENKTIFLNKDDMQVATEMMTGARLIRDALAKWQERGTLDALMMIDPVTKDLIQIYLKEVRNAHETYAALGGVVYDKMLMLYDKAEDF